MTWKKLVITLIYKRKLNLSVNEIEQVYYYNSMMYQIDDVALKSPIATNKKGLLSANSQVTWYMKSTIKKIVYELPNELPNDLSILGNYEIMEKSQKRMEAPSLLSRKKTSVLVVKTFTKTDIEVSRPVRLCLISSLSVSTCSNLTIKILEQGVKYVQS